MIISDKSEIIWDNNKFLTIYVAINIQKCYNQNGRSEAI